MDESVFHTKHDFTPPLGWAAFNFLASAGGEGLTSDQLKTASVLTGSPLSRRANLTKLLSAMQQLQLVTRGQGARIHLTDLGQAIANGIGRFEEGFCSAVHCIYFWTWILHGDPEIASPSWSYQEVCRQILNAGPEGISSDDLVLRIVEQARSRFAVDKVSFSIASVYGVTMWLLAQSPPLIWASAKRFHRDSSLAWNTDTLRLQLAAACAAGRGRVSFDSTALQTLSACLLCPADELDPETLVPDTDEFLFVSGVPSALIFTRSGDPFIEHIGKGWSDRL
ncbi:MAG: hypothetical protein L0Z46_09005 [Nitrospiraceae bacterium]|nr:hypothetical protein [Nitrospiraceae bacterium]